MDKKKIDMDLLNNWENKTFESLFILFTSKGRKIKDIDEDISKLLYPLLGSVGINNNKGLINDNKQTIKELEIKLLDS